MNQAETNELILNALLESSDGDFRALTCAVHNLFTHGEVFEKYGYDFEDEDLGKVFNHLEGLIASVDKIIS